MSEVVAFLIPAWLITPWCVLQLQVRHRNSVAPGTGIAWRKFLDSPPLALLCLHAFPQLMSGRLPPVLRSRKLPTRVSHLAHKQTFNQLIQTFKPNFEC